MYHTGLIRSTELYRFLNLQTIEELELNTSEYFLDDDIDEDNTEDFAETPEPLPTYFNSQLFLPLRSILKSQRPHTHELVNPLDDVVVPSHTQKTYGEPWSTPVATSGHATRGTNTDLSLPGCRNMTLDDEEDNWVNFASIRRQPDPETGFSEDRSEEELDVLEWGFIDSGFPNKNRQQVVIMPRPIWPHRRAPPALVV